FPIGRCSRSYRRSNCSGSVGVGYSTISLTLMALCSLDVSDVSHVSIGLDGPRDYRASSASRSLLVLRTGLMRRRPGVRLRSAHPAVTRMTWGRSHRQVLLARPWDVVRSEAGKLHQLLE